MPSPQTERRTLPELVAALHAAGLVDPADPLHGAERLVGWESVVVRTTDGWIHRFARTDRTSFERELAVLALVDGRLGLPTPRVERIGSADLIMSYRTITGHPLDLPRVLSLPADQRAQLTRSWAALLAALHGLTAEIGGRVALPSVDHGPMVDAIRAAAEQADGRGGPVHDRLVAELDAWDRHTSAGRRAGVTAPTVLLHGDFHPGNMVFTGPTGAVSGLYDFSCVELGDPADDFRYLVGDSVDLATEIAEHYTALTGRVVDLERARITGRLEELDDALIEGRTLPA